MEYERVVSILEQIANLLRAAKEDRWVEVVAEASKRILSSAATTQAAGLEVVRSFFGGMGSLQDLVFSEELDNVPEGYSPEKANARFQAELDKLYKLIE